jgi:hypothetical protein
MSEIFKNQIKVFDFKKVKAEFKNKNKSSDFPRDFYILNFSNEVI